MTVEDEVPITQWEAERKKEVSSVCWDQLRQGCDSLGWEKEGEGQWAELEVCWGWRWCWAGRYRWAPASGGGLPSKNPVTCLISAR